MRKFLNFRSNSPVGEFAENRLAYIYIFNNVLKRTKRLTNFSATDRNGRYFEPILDYMRTGSLVIPPGMSKELVLREATFYLPNMPGNSHSNSNYFARTSCLRVTEVISEKLIIAICTILIACYFL